MRVGCLLFFISIILAIGVLVVPGYAIVNPKTAVGIWFLDEENGNTITDSSSQANHGMLVNSPERIDGVFGKALSFNGANYVEVADSDSFDITDAITVTAWAYRAGPQTSWRVLVTREKGTGSEEHFFLGFSGNDARWFVHTQENAYSDTGIGPTIPAGEWTHMAGTYEGSDVVLYINGKEEFTVPHSGILVDDVNPVIIGAGTNNSGTSFVEYFTGNIDEVAIFNVALSADDIGAIMSQGLARAAAVSVAGKLATTWAGIKERL